jgi:hypothetical protein
VHQASALSKLYDSNSPYGGEGRGGGGGLIVNRQTGIKVSLLLARRLIEMEDEARVVCFAQTLGKNNRKAS